jgi:hypothetical protein
LTFYRRFAELLDILFNATDVKIADGETGSKSSKTAIEINKALFHTSDTSPMYPRKIDLLLKLSESTTVELSSSEWKKSSVSEAIILKQQTKNLKTNTCILSTLRSLYGSQFKDVLAMDWIGNVGYLYRIEKDDQVFIASQIDSLIILLYTGRGRILTLTGDSVSSDFAGFSFDIMEYYSNECTDNGDLLLYMSDLQVTVFTNAWMRIRSQMIL